LHRSHKVLMVVMAGLILAYAPLARTLQKWMRNTFGPTGMSLAVLAGFIIVGIVFIILLRPRRIPRFNLYALAGWIAAGLAVSFLLELPEERIHLAQFGALGVLACCSYRNHNPIIGLWLAKPLIFIILIGIADEVFQYFLPDRVGDIRDVLFNTLGGIWGMLLYLGAVRREKPEIRMTNPKPE